MISKGQIRLVHLAKSTLGLTDEEYREMLQLHAGVSSSRDLSPQGFFELMERFRELGFMPRGENIYHTARSAPEGPGMMIEMVTPAQRAKIRSLEAELGWSDNPARLQGFVMKRMGIVRILTKEQASKVIEALKAMAERQKGGESETA